MKRPKNPYTKLVGYKYPAYDFTNGWFVVFDRSKLGHPWYTEPEKHKWLVKKMPDGPTKTASTLSEAQLLANVSARSIHSYDHWWLATDK